MLMITTIEEAQEILDQDPELVVCMKMDMSCWIRKGIRDSKAIPVANGEFIEQISESVFEKISKGMEQEYCSEFFQKRAMELHCGRSNENRT